jgi:hypothetical protein
MGRAAKPVLKFCLIMNNTTKKLIMLLSGFVPLDNSEISGKHLQCIQKEKPMKNDFKDAKILYSGISFTLYVYNENGKAGSIYVVPPYAGRSGEITLPFIYANVKIDKVVYVFRINDGCQANKKTTLDNLALAHDRFLDTIGEPVDVFAMCQGWTILPYAASSFSDGKIKSINMFASPINKKTGEPNGIEDYCKIMSMDYHRARVAANNGVQSGLDQWLAFFFNDPFPVAVTQYQDLFALTMACDTKGLKKWWRNYNWLVDYRPIAGTLFLEMLHDFKHNDLYEGRMEVLDEPVNLKNITCPVSVWMGKDDNITHERQGLDFLKVVGSEVKHGVVFEGRSVEELRAAGIKADKPEAVGHTAPYVKGWCIQHVLEYMGYC